LGQVAAAKDDRNLEVARDLAEEAAEVARQVGFPRWIKAVERLQEELA
jgi:hypothetical protein